MINTTIIKKEDIMVNSVVISGCFKCIQNKELLLKVEGLENHQIIRINISKVFQKKFRTLDFISKVPNFLDVLFKYIIF